MRQDLINIVSLFACSSVGICKYIVYTKYKATVRSYLDKSPNPISRRKEAEIRQVCQKTNAGRLAGNRHSYFSRQLVSESALF
ncbi:hypothetical protein J6590_092195 [Homalodisca vitripennis]|nr:hypothetical protein J6590_092195 [Homalodisca vitripennis]